jgi:hypothetical protein
MIKSVFKFGLQFLAVVAVLLAIGFAPGFVEMLFFGWRF